MKNNLLPIAKEGWIFIYASVGLFLFALLFGFEYLEFFSLMATLFFIFVFRNPEREVLIFEDGSVVSPVDGVVLSIEEMNQNGYKIEINSTYMNAGLLRAPFISKVKDIKINYGAKLPLENPLAKHLNENAEIVFTDKKANTIKIKHILKQSFKSINIASKKEQNLFQGVRYGFALNGITMLYLPKNFRLNVGVGSELIASETLVGYFTHE